MIPEVDDDYISSEDEMDEKNILDPSYLLDPQNAPSRKAKTVLEKELEFQIRKRTIVIGTVLRKL